MYILVPFIVFWNKTFNNVNLQNAENILFKKSHSDSCGIAFQNVLIRSDFKRKKPKIMQYISKVYVYDRVQYIIEGT